MDRLNYDVATAQREEFKYFSHKRDALAFMKKAKASGKWTRKPRLYQISYNLTWVAE